MSVFQQLLAEHGIETSTEGKRTVEGWIQFNCPYCGLDNGMGYNTRGGYLNCWQCGLKDLAESLLMITGISRQELWAIMPELRKEGVKRTRKEDTVVQRKTVNCPKGTYDIRLSKVHKKYLRGRGYNLESLIRLWSLQAIKLHPRYGWRVFIPVIRLGRMVSFTTRTIGNAEPKYLHANPTDEVLPIHDLLYGEDYVRSTVVIHEGPADVWATGPGAVCTFGMSPGTAQIERLTRYPRRVVCFDAEPAAQRRAAALCDQLALCGGTVHNVVLQTGKDTGDADPQEVAELRQRFLSD